MFGWFKKKQPSPEPAQKLVPSLAAAENAFAIDLWRALGPDRGNQVIAPGSLWLALAMTSTGASGETRAQLERVLRVPPESFDEQVRAQLAAWDVEDQDAGLTVRTVNRIFTDDRTPFSPVWLDDLERTWGTVAARLDFRAPEAARAFINSEVARHTAERVRELLPRGSIEPETRLVLISAALLLARWLQPFRRDDTSPAPFFSAEGEHECSLMQQVGHFGWYEDEHVQVLSMPFEGSPMSMVVVLPRARDGLPALERTMTAELVEGWLSKQRPGARVDVSLPKFDVTRGASVALSEVLKGLGVSLPFDRERADFTTMANPTDPDERLVVAEVFHQAVVKVDERGIEAAATSAVTAVEKGTRERATDPFVFRADHPFLFMLRDTSSGAWLFLGRLTQP